MESDDTRPDPFAFRRMLRALSAHPSWDGVSCMSSLCGADDRLRMQAYLDWQNSLSTPGMMASGRFVEMPALHQTAIFRRGAVEDVLAPTGGRYRDGPWRGGQGGGGAHCNGSGCSNRGVSGCSQCGEDTHCSGGGSGGGGGGTLSIGETGDGGGVSRDSTPCSGAGCGGGAASAIGKSGSSEADEHALARALTAEAVAVHGAIGSAVHSDAADTRQRLDAVPGAVHGSIHSDAEAALQRLEDVHGDAIDTPVDMWWWLAFFHAGKVNTMLRRPLLQPAQTLKSVFKLGGRARVRVQGDSLLFVRTHPSTCGSGSLFSTRER